MKLHLLKEGSTSLAHQRSRKNDLELIHIIEQLRIRIMSLNGLNERVALVAIVGLTPSCGCDLYQLICCFIVSSFRRFSTKCQRPSNKNWLRRIPRRKERIHKYSELSNHCLLWEALKNFGILQEHLLEIGEGGS